MRANWLLVAVGVLAGCSQPKNTRSDAIEGRPPAPSEDPFFFVAIPSDAIQVDTTGTIAAPTPAANPDNRALEAERQRLADREIQLTRKEQELDARAQKIEALEKSLTARATPAKATTVERAVPETPRNARCFSCVKLCVGKDKCDVADTICGWGAHPDTAVSGKLATAKCDGALRQLEATGEFRKIEGRCPIATCE